MMFARGTGGFAAIDVSALFALTSPQPLYRSHPGVFSPRSPATAEGSLALMRITLRICSGVSEGRFDAINAATPATTGDAADVPLYPS